MELRQLEHFVAVAEHQHFTRAAESLQISQSGLSASIRALEAELGTTLFTRSTRRVQLTPAGTAMLEESQRAVSSAAAARDAVLAVRGVLGGTLRIGTEQCLGGPHLPRELADFRLSHPAVSVRLGFAGSTQLIEQVANGLLDLALVADCGATPSAVELLPVASEGFVVLCHPDHALAGRRDRVDIGELAGETFVGFADGWAARVLADRAFALDGIAHSVELEVGDVGSLLDLVGYGLGIAVVPAHFALKRPEQLAAVPVVHDALVWTTAIAVPRRAAPAAAALVGRLRRPALVPAA
ncbi:LysR family transcriptional regulator [Agreia sp. COWG]|uniref:LysR family transcriptional regulator n=1 Tax=Agreia sp. COWG TaxID=2773266 RepID=UPI0019293A43|nr:LysR family transcriptional regulator [Agreia sp. COWG]CAD6007751.1 DNA-binding transcriptional regulator, LysR family [Agreia sp. COWG]